MEKTDRRKNLIGATFTSDQFEGIVLGRENEVVRHGYRSAADQINELTRSGMQLQMSREDRYAQPTGINVRMYGEVDKTIAEEKMAALKINVQERKKKAAEEQAAEQERLQKEREPKSKVETTPEGGVT